MEEVVIDSLLGEDIYVTLKGRWKEKPVIIKLFVVDSDLNNEYNLMGHLQKISFHPEWFPKPYFIHLPGSGIFRALGMTWKVYFAIVYEYIEGTIIDFKTLDLEEKIKMKTEVKEQLDELHRLGLIHGDVRGANIIRTPDRFLLIDYGRSYSLDGTFPALDFMVEDNFMITQEDDLTALSLI